MSKKQRVVDTRKKRQKTEIWLRDEQAIESTEIFESTWDITKGQKHVPKTAYIGTSDITA